MIERGRKNRTNIRKQVVRKPAMLAQTMRRRILLTGGSGADSTTSAGGFPAGFAGVFAVAGAAGAGGSATATDVSLVGTRSTPMTSRKAATWNLKESHCYVEDCELIIQSPTPQGSNVSAKPKCVCSLKNAPRPKRIINWRGRRLLYIFRVLVGKNIVKIRIQCANQK